jgi:hypothetical protein
MVYPLSAKQHVNGALMDKAAKSFQNGAWVEWWNGELYKNGIEYERITGGWEQYIDSGGSITKNADNITLILTGVGGKRSCGVVNTINKVDLTNITTLHINPDWIMRMSSSGNTVAFGAADSKPRDYNTLSYPAAVIYNGDTLDVSGLSGEYYIYVGAAFDGSANYYADIKMTEVREE